MSVSTPFLHTIQPVSEDRPAEAVAREILALIRSEYRYTIADLCRMFCCERQWIEDFFVPNIRHIHVNHFFMSYIIQQFADRLTPEEQSHLIHGTTSSPTWILAVSGGKMRLPPSNAGP